MNSRMIQNWYSIHSSSQYPVLQLYRATSSNPTTKTIFLPSLSLPTRVVMSIWPSQNNSPSMPFLLLTLTVAASTQEYALQLVESVNAPQAIYLPTVSSLLINSTNTPPKSNYSSLISPRLSLLSHLKQLLYKSKNFLTILPFSQSIVPQ